MKGALYFKLPEENSEFKEHVNINAYIIACHDLNNYARSLRKHDDRDSIPKEEVVEKIYELLSEVNALD